MSHKYNTHLLFHIDVIIPSNFREEGRKGRKKRQGKRGSRARGTKEKRERKKQEGRELGKENGKEDLGEGRRDFREERVPGFGK